MKSEDFANNLLKEEYLVETSLSRIFILYEKGEFAIITANLRKNTPQENKYANERMRSDLRSLGLGFVPVEGCGQETSPETGLLETVRENSFFVPDTGHLDDFLGKILELATKYEQTCVLHAVKGTASLLTPDGTVLDTKSSIHAGMREYFSRRNFKLDSLKSTPVANLMDAWAKASQGELYPIYRMKSSI